jgi:hypothetical protein
MSIEELTPVPYETVRDNALHYGRSPSAPASISPVDIDQWKAEVSPTFKNYFTERYNALVRDYEELVEEFNLNKLVYESEINFKPVIGEIYHLYTRSNMTRFLSLVHPSTTYWSGYLGSFRLTTQYAWERV